MTIAAADALMGIFGMKRVKVIKAKTCKCCVNDFFPSFPLQKGCSFDCELKLGLAAAAKSKERREQKEKAADREKLESMRPRRYWKAKLKKIQHAYVRARDEGKPCISCDTILVKLGRVGGDYDAGHCRSVGSAKHLEDDERNIHGQCKHCNSVNGLGGNYHEYRKRLPARIGQATFDALMCDQEPRHRTIPQLQERIEFYTQALKELKHG